jgi:hypothetical protein
MLSLPHRDAAVLPQGVSEMGAAWTGMRQDGAKEPFGNSECGPADSSTLPSL